MPKIITDNIITKFQDELMFLSQTHHESKFYMGWELEIDGADVRIGSERMADKIKSIVNMQGKFEVNSHYDGSLDNGIEIVSMPATLGAIKNSAPQLIKMFEEITLNRFVNDNDKAGFHVHLAKRSLGKTKEMQENRIEKITKWMYTNKADMIKFAGRDSRWATYYENAYSRQDRYQALNVWTKKDRYRNVQIGKTIEFRIFKGVTNYYQFMAYLELVNLIARTVTDGSKDLASMKMDDLIGITHKAKAVRNTPHAYNHWMGVRG
jgi:hypothetical protein